SPIGDGSHYRKRSLPGIGRGINTSFSGTQTMKKCAVIGSGIAGLASAIRTAKQGFAVTVYERNDHPGGKISQYTKDGFRFDLGPSVFTLPELIDELFTLWGKDPRDYFSYTRLDPAFHYFFE